MDHVFFHTWICFSGNTPNCRCFYGKHVWCYGRRQPAIYGKRNYNRSILFAFGRIVLLPIFYLYKFSKYSKTAIYSEDSEQLSLAFKYLKKHYKFIGILSIILLSFYVLAFLIMSIAGGIGAFM